MKDLIKLADDLPVGVKAEVENNHVKIIIPSVARLNNFRLFDMIFSNDDYAASMNWMGKTKDLSKIVMQTAIQIRERKLSCARSLAYDGQANFINGHDTLIFPNNGNIYATEPDPIYYFNNGNPLLPNYDYNLDFNNKSILLDNISLFNESFSEGVMLDFRASMNGVFEESDRTGYVIVMAQIDNIK